MHQIKLRGGPEALAVRPGPFLSHRSDALSVARATNAGRSTRELDNSRQMWYTSTVDNNPLPGARGVCPRLPHGGAVYLCTKEARRTTTNRLPLQEQGSQPERKEIQT